MRSRNLVQFQILGDSIEDLLQSEEKMRTRSSLEPRIFARSGNGEQSISFDMPGAVEVQEESVHEVPLTNIFVDKSRFNLAGVQDLSMSARILKYKIPGRGHTEWVIAAFDEDQGAVCNTANAQCVESHGFAGCEPCMFASAPTLQLDCQPHTVRLAACPWKLPLSPVLL